MSGGSFGYIHSRDLGETPEMLIEMRDALPEGSRARAQTDAVIKAYEHLRELAGPTFGPDGDLRSVWKAMEWWQSGDWGEDRFKAALEKYEQSQE